MYIHIIHTLQYHVEAHANTHFIGSSVPLQSVTSLWPVIKVGDTSTCVCTLTLVQVHLLVQEHDVIFTVAVQVGKQVSY